RFLIGSSADAEQHLFVDADKQGRIRTLVWVQFEHRLPTDNGSYEYPAPGRAQFGQLPFITDTRAFADYADTVLSPDSTKGAGDQSHVGRLLRDRGYTPPRNAIRARMVCLVDQAHRKELMIIYAKALTPGDLAGRALPAISPGTDWPDLSQRVVEDAQR